MEYPQITDILFEQFLVLPLYDLIAFGSTNKLSRKVFDDEHIWKLRSKKEIRTGCIEFKPSHITYKEFYIDHILHEGVLYDHRFIEEGRIDLLIGRTINIGRDSLEGAVKNGHLDTIKFLYSYDCSLKSMPNYAINSYVMKSAVEEAEREIFEWTLTNEPEITWRILDSILKNGWVDIHHRLSDGTLPTAEGANSMAGYGNIEMLNHLASRGILPDQNGVVLAAVNGMIPVLEWLRIRGIILNPDLLYRVIESGRLKVLKWLSVHGVVPDQSRSYDSSQSAVKSGKLSVLQWLNSMNIEIHTSAANYSTFHGHIKILKWLIQLKIYPDRDHVDKAIFCGHFDIVKLLADEGIFPTESGPNIAAGTGRVDILEWFESRGILPTTIGANVIIPPEIFYRENHRPSMDIDHRTVNRSRRPKQAETLRWLLSRGVRPTEIPLHIIIDGGNGELMRVILENKFISDETIAVAVESINVKSLKDYAGLMVAIEWLIQHNICIFPSAVQEIMAWTSPGVLDLFEKYGILPDIHCANLAAQNGKTNLLKWMRERGILPNITDSTYIYVNRLLKHWRVIPQ